MTPFGTLKRSPSSSAVPPTMTFLPCSFCSVAGSPRSTSAKDTLGMPAVRMLKSIRKGVRFSAYWPASTAAIEGTNLPSSFSPNG